MLFGCVLKDELLNSGLVFEFVAAPVFIKPHSEFTARLTLLMIVSVTGFLLLFIMLLMLLILMIVVERERKNNEF